jgi:hypothetical protein
LTGDCGPVFCEPDTPTELLKTTKHLIIMALSRAQMGGIKNLDWINWVIEPLNAHLKNKDKVCTGTDATDGFLEGECTIDFTLQPLALKLPIWSRKNCPANVEGNEKAGYDIDASYVQADCDDRTIFPTTLAAECIVRSLLPTDGSITIIRSNTVFTP